MERPAPARGARAARRAWAIMRDEQQGDHSRYNYRLRRRRSQTKNCKTVRHVLHSTHGWIRTTDPTLNRGPLYPLSYMGISSSVFQSQIGNRHSESAIPPPSRPPGRRPAAGPFVSSTRQSRNATCSIACACDSVFITTLCQYGSFTVAWSGWRIWPRTYTSALRTISRQTIDRRSAASSFLNSSTVNPSGYLLLTSTVSPPVRYSDSHQCSLPAPRRIGSFRSTSAASISIHGRGRKNHSPWRMNA